MEKIARKPQEVKCPCRVQECIEARALAMAERKAACIHQEVHDLLARHNLTHGCVMGLAMWDKGDLPQELVDSCRNTIIAGVCNHE